MDLVNQIMEIITNIITNFTNCVTIIAIGVGGFWAYYLFIKNRQEYPRAEVKHKLIQKHLDYGKILLHVEVEVVNLGEVLISLESGEVRLLQVLPVQEEIEKAIQSDEDPVGKGKYELDWCLLAERKLFYKETSCEIEPKESDKFHFDFVIKNDIQTVEIYSHFKNQRKKDKKLGWDCTSLHDIEGGTKEI
jgi:hypothetical protein